ncbi:hypothetical protein [Rhodococcus jostii]|uniref:hypothetical protein n=1 Tax=Rhodococcus jostii TaxID=132919 RepID=UPI0036549FB2
MTDVSTKKNRPHRMPRWAYAPLVAAVAAGAVCTGAEGLAPQPPMRSPNSQARWTAPTSRAVRICGT